MMLEAPDELAENHQRDFAQGWQALQGGNLEAASSELEPLSRRYSTSREVVTARGYLELRLGDFEAADRFFQIALRAGPGYGPAQSGYFLSALATGNEELAYGRLTRLERDYPQHPFVDRYETTLQVNVAEARLAVARQWMQEGSYVEAADAYGKALEIVTDVAGLYVEAAEAELAAGAGERAVRYARRATELEPENADAYKTLGEAHYDLNELPSAYEAYKTASELSPRDVEIRDRFVVVEREYQEVTLPPEYVEIESADRLTREQLAALLYLELRSAFDDATTESSVIATDIADSWAENFILRVARAGVLEVFPNHMFQPTFFVRRVELAQGLAGALELSSPDGYRAARESPQMNQSFPDLSPQNLNYEAAALVVSLGLMTPTEEGDFEPQGFVSGLEAVTAVEALSVHLSP